METQDGDEEVFEIVDFTTASEWEVFTAQVEEAMQEWQLCGDRPQPNTVPPNSLGTKHWRELKQIINYSDFPFELSYHSVVHESSTPCDDIPDGRPSGGATPPLAGEHGEEEDDDEFWLPSSLANVHDCDNCFPSRAHCVARWYGLREFLVAAPASSSCSVAPSKARLILSALTMAASNANCQVAVLVQVLRPTDRHYLGTLTAAGLRTDLDMIHIKARAPPDCHHYQGLVDLMSKKVRVDAVRLSPLASVRFTYMLRDWPEEACWSQPPPDLDLDCSAMGDVGYSGLKQLPFGLLYDPVRELHLSAMWPRLYHSSFKDSSQEHTLDPCKAPHWTAKVLPHTGSSEGPQVAGLLGEHLVELLAACRDERTVRDLLGAAFQDYGLDEVVGISSALDRLTEHSVPSLGSVIMGKRRQHHAASGRSDKSQQGPLSTEVLVPMLNLLFPEEGEEEVGDGGTTYPSTFGRVPSWPEGVKGLPEEHPLKDVLVGVKSAPADSLVWRLAVLCCHALHSLGGLPAVAHLQYELLLELRFRWDNCLPLPGVDESAPPDLASSLLHQKLQMLNCCIAHRANKDGVTSSSAAAARDEPDEPDEFYDCLTEDEDQDEFEDDDAPPRSAPLSSWDRPEGRLRACGRLRLLGPGRDRLFVPVTQDPAPVTEDRLEEQAQMLLRLGDNDEGSVMRARLMSSSLLSDMEAFKAANPGCQLADFVRWYSPRDWVPAVAGAPDSQQHVVDGHTLSDRMTLPGNLWQEVWQSAQPVPARRQKRLFDDAREAELSLQWLSCLSPGQLCQHLLPVLLHAACCRVADQPTLYTLPSSAVWGSSVSSEVVPALQHSGQLSALLAVVAQRLGRLSRQPCDLNKYHEVVEQLIAIEKCIGRALSLRHKLLPQSLADLDSTSSTTGDSSAGDATARDGDTGVLVKLISELLSSGEVEVVGAADGVAGQAILRLFDRALQYQDHHYPPPSSELSSSPNSRLSLAERTPTRLGFVGAREYIVRIRAEYPGKHSRVMPHRLYATFLNNDFRIAGLFTQDTNFT